MRFVALLACIASAASCASDPTQIMVVVRSDLSVPEELDEVRINVFGLGDQPTVNADLRAEDLPRTLAIVRTGGPLGPVVVEARGYQSGGLVVTRRARVSFVRNEARMLILLLEGSCVGVDCGDDELTCTGGSCQLIDVANLPPWPGRVPDDAAVPRSDAGSDGGEDGAVDSGTDSSVDSSIDSGVDADTDAGFDAGFDADLPDGCTLMTCGSGCDCTGPCPCLIECRRDSNCRGSCSMGVSCNVTAARASELNFTCDGASCAINARNSSNALGTVCENGADCEVDCTGSSNCEVRCNDTSACLLDCSGVSNCRLRGCSSTRCGDGIRVCNRACP